MTAKLKREKMGMKFFKKSLKLLSQSQPNFAEMILGWFPSKIVSDISDLQPRWPPQPNLISFFLFLAWRPSWLEAGITEYNFGRGQHKDNFTKVWLQLAQ
jgi:hypothetical protein